MKLALPFLAAATCLVLLAADDAPDARFLTIQDPIVVYNNWSSYDELSDNVPLTEQLAMRELNEVLRLRGDGVPFDYYMMDAFWYAKDGGYREWRKSTWPNGPDVWLNRCRENGIKPGMWFGTDLPPSTGPVRNLKISRKHSVLTPFVLVTGDVVHRDLPLQAPGQEVPRGEFRAVVHPQRFRTATMSDHIFENTRDTLTRKRSVCFQSQAFASEVIDDAQHAHTPTICQRVTHEV